MPPAGWNGFPSGCQGNLWSTPPPPSPPASATTLRLHRARVKLSTRAQAHGKPHHTHCYTDGKIQRRVRVYRPSARDAYTSSESWTPHCCERPCWIRYSAFLPAFPVFLHGFRRWWTDECGSRVSLLLIECQNFLKCIRTKNRVIFLSQRRNFEVSKNLSFQIPFERMKILSRSWPRFTNRLWKRCDGSTYRTRNLSLSFIGR